MRYAFVQEEAKTHSVDVLCRVLSVSRSGYYKWSQRPVSQRERTHQQLLPKIKAIFVESRETYGYRRVVAVLREQQENCGKHRVANLMRKLCLCPVMKRRFKATTDSHHTHPVHANILNRQFKPQTSNQSWVSDLTYISTGQGWMYVAVVMDLFSRAIVGWAMDKQMKEELVSDALRMALLRRKMPENLLLHSDRGSQYASRAYQTLLKQYGITCSMSRKGNCWDNAPMESFFKTLKTECVYRQPLQTREEAKARLFDYIEVFYNRQRQHSSLNYLSPMGYELATANL